MHAPVCSAFPNAGIGLAVENASQWKDVLKEAAQVAVIIVIIDRLGFIDSETWLEGHADTLSVQATLFGRAVTWWGGLMHFVDHTHRIEME